MLPCQFSIHHVNTVHGSGVNRSKSSNWICHKIYIIDVLHLKEKNDRALHVSGKKNIILLMMKLIIKNNLDINKQYKNSTGVFGNKNIDYNTTDKCQFNYKIISFKLHSKNR